MGPKKIKNRTTLWPSNFTSGDTQKNWKQGLKEIFVYLVALFMIVQKWSKCLLTDKMDKQSVVYASSGTLFNFKKEGNSDTCYSMDEPWGTEQSEIAKLVTSKASHINTNTI